MQKFDFGTDGTIEEFKRRVSKSGPVNLSFDDSSLYVAIAASLWFSMELYEKRVGEQIKERNGSIQEHLALHELVHDMKDVLSQMFEGVGMDLVNVPLMCLNPDKDIAKDIGSLMGVLSEIKDVLTQMEDAENTVVPDSVPEDLVQEVTEEAAPVAADPDKD